MLFKIIYAYFWVHVHYILIEIISVCPVLALPTRMVICSITGFRNLVPSYS